MAKAAQANPLAEIVGWYGTAAILGAYALNSFGVISASSAAYQLLNLTGALGIIAISLRKNVMQSVVLNVIWGVIALVALARLFF